MSLPVRVITSESEKIASAQYSKGPNLIATDARSGEIIIRSPTPISVPTSEKVTPVPRAFAPRPFSAIGLPSKQVATDDGVPGIFKSIAEIRPPEIPPIYNATSIDIP